MSIERECRSTFGDFGTLNDTGPWKSCPCSVAAFTNGTEVIGEGFGLEGNAGVSSDVSELLESRRALVIGRKAWDKMVPTRVLALTSRRACSSGSGLTVDFHNMRSHLRQAA